jgi:hypothetical protein
MRLSLRITGTGGGVGSRIVWKFNGVTQGNTTPPTLAALKGEPREMPAWSGWFRVDRGAI